MRASVLVAEIGSTVTKVHAFANLDTSSPAWLGSGSAPTTVSEGDVTAGLRNAIADLARAVGGDIRWDRMMAASSAAGGLRMSVHGLVIDMTVRAAREAALGAGGIVDLVTSGEMGAAEAEALKAARPGIILLAGGVEGGDREVIVANARTIAASGIRAPVVYAGNGLARAEAVAVLEDAGLEVKVVPNVYPRLDELDVEPTRRAIQEVFERHIVAAPGMERVRDLVAGSILPTPGAVMESAKALQGILGDLVVIDVGGATTDVHSVTEGSAAIARIQTYPEPAAKRTVEGDLGVYVNSANVVRLAGLQEVGRYIQDIRGSGERGGRGGIPGGGEPEELGDLLSRLAPLPPGDMDPDMTVLVEALACLAAETAMVRHAGRLRHLFGPTGRVTVAEGKDLTEVEWLVGTGGPLTQFPHARETLARIVGLAPGVVEARSKRSGDAAGYSSRALGPPGHYLLPGRGVRPLLDSRYIMAVLGVLRQDYPEAADTLLRESLGGACHV
ncbi:MAG: DNA mismatch repair protein MutL [Bacillota bacterium]|nr:MAG: DNA mismatch repair protein MutL [Bacillota bacterium]